MRVCIRRGAKQIGGTCIEIESQGKRLVLDVGMPLDAEDPAKVELPAVPGFNKKDPALLGIILSHPHMDHYGLAFRVPKTTPFLMGAAAERILAAAAVFTPSGGSFDHVIHLVDRQPIPLGPFVITPFLMDHSAYDSYAVLVEADGKRLFYTGDLRAHGRKAKLFERLVAHPPTNVDVLLMEGTTIKRQGTEEGFPTETDLEKDLVRIIRATAGMPLVWCSGQNIDRLVTVFRAAKQSGRQLIVDMYTAHILKATGNQNLPQADWEGMRVFLPEFQKRRIRRNEEFELVADYKPYRIYPEDLATAAKHSVMLFRPSMQIDVERAGCLDGACLVYSMWDGYLADEKTQQVLSWLKERGIPMNKCHTSGHASVNDLRRLRTAFASAVVVPVHCADPEAYAKAFERVVPHEDNALWEVDSNDMQEKTNR
jgi:ribonuclease J